MDGTIYALKGDPEGHFDIFASLLKGVGRFGWSYVDTADLRQLKQRIEREGWDSLSDDEKDCYQGFLLDLEAGDHVVYINVPEWGKCTVAKVTGGYEWRPQGDDFNHCFSVDPATVYTFDRNDAVVHPALSSRLKLQGRWWRIRLANEFDALLKSLSSGVDSAPRTHRDNLRFLSTELQPFLARITECIHRTHPNYDLETLLSEVFRKVPGVIDVRQQGGAGDHGADILVTFESGLPVPGLEQKCTLIVQVKSFEGEHWDTQAVDDIRRAYEHYPEANMGLIVSTASASTPALDSAMDKLKEDSQKPLALLIGSDVAAFLLRFGANLLA